MPEQNDERTDLFSFGVIAVEVLTGRRPFDAATPQEVIVKVLNTTKHLPDESPEVARLDQVLRRCLAKDPAMRIESVAELQAELIPALINCANAAVVRARTTQLPEYSNRRVRFRLQCHSAPSPRKDTTKT